MLVILRLRFVLFHSADVSLDLCLRCGLFVLLFLPFIFTVVFLLLHFNSLFLSVIFNPTPLQRVIKAVSVFAPRGKFYLHEESGSPLK